MVLRADFSRGVRMAGYEVRLLFYNVHRHLGKVRFWHLKLSTQDLVPVGAPEERM